MKLNRAKLNDEYDLTLSGFHVYLFMQMIHEKAAKLGTAAVVVKFTREDILKAGFREEYVEPLLRTLTIKSHLAKRVK
jgi:hypothetical protein